MERTWLKNPKPDSQVVLALENALAAARRGQVRSAVLVTVNPLREVESIVCGEVDETGRIVLIGAISVVNHRLIKG